MESEQNSIQMPADKAYYLQRIEVLKELENELMLWAKKRFWILSIVVAGIALIGGASLITSMIESRVNSKVSTEVLRYETKFDKLREATIASSIATKDAEKTARHIKELLTKLTKTAENFDNNFNELSNRAKILREDLANVSTKNLLVVESVRKDLSNLTTVVAKLSPADNLLRSTVKDIKISLNTSKKEISKATTLAELTKYEVRINTLPGGEKLAKQLTDINISVNYELDGPANESIDDFRTIIVGKNVPIEMAIQVIKIAKKNIPVLSFIVTSDSESRSNRIVIGFESLEDTEAFTEEDFNFILSSKTKMELFKKIRSLKNEREK